MIILSLAQAFAALYIVMRSVIALNCMSRATRWEIRCAYILLSAGGIACIRSALTHPEIMPCLLVCGIALHMKLSKRKPPNVA